MKREREREKWCRSEVVEKMCIFIDKNEWAMVDLRGTMFDW